MEPSILLPAVELVVRATNTSSNSTANSADTAKRSPAYHVVGIILAICSGVFIGTSFVLKKTGLLRANVKYNEEAGEGYGYLKNAWWWTGMTLMIIGEICNFIAYAFVDAILVTPMGSLSVVISAILSAIFLKEKLSFVGWVACLDCIIGSVVIVLNSPAQSAVADIQEMQKFVIAPGFLTYAGVIVVGCAFVAYWAGPRYGKKSMLVYLTICSLIGGLSVVATQGLGSAIVAQAGGKPQFNQWFLYVLLVFVICTLVTEIIFLNKALNIFNAAVVTPTYYVYFTSATIVSSAILFQGFKGTALQIITLVLGFLTICSGVVLLQLAKSAKNVSEAEILKGEVDLRTIAEQQESSFEPRADDLRGAGALLRSMSRSNAREKRDQAEIKRVIDERLEPIGEDEQVEWEGLRRRKTVVSQESPLSQRRRTEHPPLGMSYFPDLEIEEDDHDPAADTGLFPGFRHRAASVFGRRRETDPRISKTARSQTMPMEEIAPPESPKVKAPSRELSFRPSYGLSPELRRATSIGLSGLQQQDTAYKGSEASKSTGSLPNPFRSVSPEHTDDGPYRPATDGATPGPTPPPHRQSERRQFSFQNVITRHLSPSRDGERPGSSESRGSFFPMMRRTGTQQATEEERLGLVTGDGSSRGRESLREDGSVRRFTRGDIPVVDEDPENERESLDVRQGASSSAPYRDTTGSSGDSNDRKDDDDSSNNDFGRRQTQDSRDEPTSGTGFV